MSSWKTLLEWKNVALALLAALAMGGGSYYFLAQRTPQRLVEMGIPMYPGAVVADNATVMKRISSPGQPRSIDAVVLLTEDHPVRITAYYQEVLKDKVRVLEMSKSGKPSAWLAVGTGTSMRWINISLDADTGKTMILITRVYK